MIPYGRQDVTQTDIDAVVAVLQSDFLTQGPAAPRFEAALAAYGGASHAVAVNSATSALHVACLALGLGPGDWLWTSPITFVASANCGLYCGAKVDFVDIDPRTYNMDPAALERKLAAAEKEGRLPKVVVPVHLCGQSCDMEAIHGLGQRYGFHIVEDASHAVGGRYRGEAVGNCRYSDITVFSFHPVKIVTTAEGGAALTNDARLAQRMALLRSHGVTRDPASMTQAPDGPWYYQQVDLGFNYRMTDMQAAIGREQLRRLPGIVRARRQLARDYTAHLAGSGFSTPAEPAWGRSNWQSYCVGLPPGLDQRTAMQALLDRGIATRRGVMNAHLEAAYRGDGLFRAGSGLERGEAAQNRSIILPLFAQMTEAELLAIVDALKDLVRNGRGIDACRIHPAA